MRNALFVFGLVSIGAACSSETVITPEKRPNQGAGGATSVTATTDAQSAIATTVTATVTTSASTGGACCDQPIQVQGPVVVKTADTDASQAFDVTTPVGSSSLEFVVQGPAVVTDLFAPNGFCVLYVLPGTSCPTMPGPNDAPQLSLNSSTAEHGAHWFVGANHVLCSINGAHVAGFKPY